ncbi:MAG TPA: hypothetical protein VL119_10400 [Acidimicrobiia bacterium]|nr:hypothetical protein [Acidimicrobiia bacterium]
MTTRMWLIFTLATIWCGATAVKAVLALVHRESYVVGWWDASIAGTGRKLDGIRTVIKLVAMLAVTAGCALVIAQVLVPSQALYLVLPAAAVTAIVELSAPKMQRGQRGSKP